MRNKQISLFILFVMLLSFFSLHCYGESDNIITNSGFEDGVIEPWKAFSKPLSLTASRELAYSGEYSMKWDGGNGPYAATGEIPVKENTVYIIKAMFFNKSTTYHLATETNFRVYNKATGENIVAGGVFDAGGKWTEKKIVYKTGENENSIKLEFQSYGTSITYVDDVYVGEFFINAELKGNQVLNKGMTGEYSVELSDQFGDSSLFVEDSAEITWRLKDNYEGITLNENGAVSIGVNCELEEFALVADIYSPTIGKSITAEKNIIVREDNYIENADFETENLFWKKDGAVMQINSTYQKNGNNSLRVSTSDENCLKSGYIKYNLNVNPDTVYIASLYSYVESGTGLDFSPVGGSGEELIAHNWVNNPQKKKWQEHSFVYKTGSTDTALDAVYHIYDGVSYIDTVYFAPLKIQGNIIGTDRAVRNRENFLDVEVFNQLGNNMGVSGMYYPEISWQLGEAYEGVRIDASTGTVYVNDDAADGKITVYAVLTSPLNNVTPVVLEKQLVVCDDIQPKQEATSQKYSITVNPGFETEDYSYFKFTDSNVRLSDLYASSGSKSLLVKKTSHEGTAMTFLDLESNNTYIFTQKVYVFEDTDAKIICESNNDIHFITNDSIHLKGGQWNEVNALFYVEEWEQNEKAFMGLFISDTEQYYTDDFCILKLRADLEIDGADYIKIPDEREVYPYTALVTDDTGKFGDILRENTESISLFFKENYSGASIFGNNIVVTPDLKAQRIVLFMTVKSSLPGVEAVTVKKNINIGYLEQEEQFSEPEISFTENLNLRFSSKLLNQVEKSSFDAIVARYQNGNFRECRVFTIDSPEKNLIEAEFENITDDCTVKIFLFENKDSLKPLITSKEYKINTVFVDKAATGKKEGSYAQPFCMLEEAKAFLRASDKAEKSYNFVLIKGGEYDNFSRFSVEDSGNDSFKIIYMGYGGKVVLKGSTRLDYTNFETIKSSDILNRIPKEARSEVLMYDLSKNGLDVKNYGYMQYHGKYSNHSTLDSIPNLPNNGELFFEGKPMQISRYPNEGYIFINNVVYEGSVEKNEGFVIQYEDQRSERWVYADHAKLYGYWKYDYGDASVDLKNVDISQKTITSVQPSYLGISERTNGDGGRYYVYNLLEEIDVPGEYYINPDENILYFYPPENFGENSVITLGTKTSDFINANNIKDITFKNFSFSESRFPAFYIVDCENIVFDNCDIFSLSGSAGSFIGGKNCGIKNSHIYDTNGGIQLQGGNKAEMELSNNFVENCEIHNFSRHIRTYNAGVSVYSVGCRVANNEIYDAPHNAIMIYSPSLCNIIEYNNIHDVVQDSQDAGAIYTGRTWVNRENIIRYNFVHNIGNGGESIVGIYLDDVFSGGYVYGNIIGDISNGYGILVGGGADNTVENNIIYRCSDSPVFADNRGKWYESFDNYKTAMEALPYRSDKWQKAFPQLYRMKNISEEWVPYGNVIKNNIILDDSKMKLDVAISENGVIENNINAPEIEYYVDENNCFNISWKEISGLMPEFEILETVNMGKTEFENKN